MQLTFKSVTQAIFEFFRSFFEKYGVTGDPALDMFLLLLVLFLVFVLLSVATVIKRGMLAKQDNKAGGFYSPQALGGRFEKLELTVNSLKTEFARAQEINKGEIGFLQQEIQEVRTLLGAAPLDIEKDYVGRSRREQDQDLDPQVEPIVDEVQQQEKLSKSLEATRTGFFGKLKALFSGGRKVDETALGELEELLIASDLGVKTSTALLEELRAEVKDGELGEKGLLAILKLKILSALEKNAPLQGEIAPYRQADGPYVVMVVGVNGVGKTTTVAKLANLWREQGLNVMIAAADTFRAAAVDQLARWGEEIDVPVIVGEPEAKPATVVFDAMERAKAEGADVLVIDTAGRLHTKANLMQELEGVLNIIKRHQASAPHEILLVLDASTGQNALSQAREFHQALKLSGTIVTKLDGSAKGGIVVAIKEELGVPVRYIGVGESKSDLRAFVARDFVEALFEKENGAELEAPSAHAEERQRKRRDTHWN